MATETVHYRTCPFCEATCGLEVTLDGDRVVSVRGDADDVFSRGFLCPKSQGLKQLHEDPDRITRPLVRRDGELREASWEEAYAAIDAGLSKVLAEGGRDAVAVYIGNPAAHSLAATLYGTPFLKALGSKNIYSASTVDQIPKQVSAGLMFGAGLSVPIPDVDRTEHLLILGANPLVSNGSLLTAPNMRGRIRAIRERGGKVVVIDPRRTRTAAEASEHHFIRPGTDAHLLFALAGVLLDEDLAEPGRLADLANGASELAELARPFTPAAVAPICGIEAEQIRRLARELAGAERAAVYARIGTTTQLFGTLASWLVDVLNYLTGNLDREGGAMFALAAAGQRNAAGTGGAGKGLRINRWQSRVSGRPETFGELPVVCMAEEITTPGEGQVRALVTIAGNPVVSTPDAAALDRAVEGLEFMVSLDIYVNETTRHADVVLPAPEPLAKSHYDTALYQLAIRSVANYSPALLAAAPEQQQEWEVLLRLAAIAAGQGAKAEIEPWDDLVVQTMIGREVALAGSPIQGRDAAEIAAALEPRRGPERLLDFLVRVGPFGDGFGADPEGLTLESLERNPHGIDMGAMRQRLPEVLRTPSGKIELAPAEIVADVPRLQAELEAGAHVDGANGQMVLIGRRQLRSNNSWMHNLPALVKGKDRCTVQVHPDDAERLGLSDGAGARVSSGVGELVAPVEITDEIMPGVISIPHGWGHDSEGVRLGVAAAHPGVNSNLLAPVEVDVPSGNAVLNGIPVEVSAVREPVPA